MPPITLKVVEKTGLVPMFVDPEELQRTWRVCTRVKDSLENGSRMENLSWRVWFLKHRQKQDMNTQKATMLETRLLSLPEKLADLKKIAPTLKHNYKQIKSPDPNTLSSKNQNLSIQFQSDGAFTLSGQFEDLFGDFGSIFTDFDIQTASSTDLWDFDAPDVNTTNFSKPLCKPKNETVYLSQASNSMSPMMWNDPHFGSSVSSPYSNFENDTQNQSSLPSTLSSSPSSSTSPSPSPSPAPENHFVQNFENTTFESKLPPPVSSALNEQLLMQYIQNLQCCSCGKKEYPLWRKSTDMNDFSVYCSDCAKVKYVPKTGLKSTEKKKPTYPTKPCAQEEKKEILVCTNCSTMTTPLWRRNDQGNVLCNACGLYLKLHRGNRPISMKTDIIKKRQRSESNGFSKRKKSNPSPNFAPSNIHPPLISLSHQVPIQINHNYHQPIQQNISFAPGSIQSHDKIQTLKTISR